MPSTATDFTLDNKFLINFDTMQYINLNEYKANTLDKFGFNIHPLPLLTAVGNERGCGDFHEAYIGFEFVGIWAWNLISFTDLPPKDFEKVNIIFIEERADSYAKISC